MLQFYHLAHYLTLTVKYSCCKNSHRNSTKKKKTLFKATPD